MCFFSTLSEYVWEFSKRHPGIVLVVVGVAGEGVDIFVKIFFKEWSKKRELGIEIIAAIFWAMVVFGLTLEMFEAAKSDKEFMVLTKQSADANKLAGEANERAAKFEREAGELFKVGEQAKQSTANAEVELEKAKTEREKAEAGRLELEKQVLALVKKTKVRTISKNAKDALNRILVGVPKGHIDIIMFDKDPESIAFGIELKGALIDADCSVSFSPKSIFNLDIIPSIVESGYDLVFCVKDDSSPPLYSRLILGCLKNDNLKAGGWPYNKTLLDNDMQIWICPKAVHPDE